MVEKLKRKEVVVGSLLMMSFSAEPPTQFDDFYYVPNPPPPPPSPLDQSSSLFLNWTQLSAFALDKRQREGVISPLIV